MPSFSVLPGVEGFFVFIRARRRPRNRGRERRMRTRTIHFHPPTGLSTVNPFSEILWRTNLKDQSMKKCCFVALALAGVLALAPTVHAQFAGTVLNYNPGTGFADSFTNASTALGAPSQINPFSENTDPFDPPYGTNQIVSIGAGGSLTLQLSTPILNNPGNPFGIDFIIFGNSGFIITNGDYSGGGITDGSLFGNNTGSTLVQVSTDGLTWYSLNPALAPTVDGLYPTFGSGDPQVPVNPALTPTDFGGQGLSG